jgi:hypothetical protein
MNDVGRYQQLVKHTLEEEYESDMDHKHTVHGFIEKQEMLPSANPHAIIL